MDDLILETENDSEYIEIGELVLHADDSKENNYMPESYEDLFIGADIENDPDDTPLIDDLAEEENNYYTMHATEKPSAFNIWFIAISLILLITVAVLCVCIFYIPTKAGTTPTAYLQEIFETIFAK
jgi:hypothetical protein